MGRGDLGDGGPPAGSTERAPIGVWERSPPEAEALSINESKIVDV